MLFKYEAIHADLRNIVKSVNLQTFTKILSYFEHKLCYNFWKVFVKLQIKSRTSLYFVKVRYKIS